MRVEIVSKVLLPLLTYLSFLTYLFRQHRHRSLRSLPLSFSPTLLPPDLASLVSLLPRRPAPAELAVPLFLSFGARQPHTASLEES